MFQIVPFYKFSVCIYLWISSFLRWSKKQHLVDVIDGPVAFLCPVLLGPVLFEIVRNRRLICSEETPASLTEVNRSFGFKSMILISLALWAPLKCDWQSHKSIQEHFGRAKLESFFSYRLVLLFLQSSSKNKSEHFDSTNECNETAFLNKKTAVLG